MSNNINSFSENVQSLIKATTTSIKQTTALQESIIGNKSSITFEIDERNELTGKYETKEYSMPSFSKVANDVNVCVDTINSFLTGKGEIKTSDGTYVSVNTQGFPIPPNTIDFIESPMYFNTSNNWFFENLLFPKLNVKLDINKYVSDDTEGALVRRLIIKNDDISRVNWFKNKFEGQQYTYSETISILNENNINYWEDENTFAFPHINAKYIGSFKITGKTVIDGTVWYLIDKNTYSLNNNEKEHEYNIKLKKGDKLSYSNKSVFKILDISENNDNIKISISPIFGFADPTTNQYFNIYDDEIIDKHINIGIGYDEMNIIFVKSINKHYNLLSREWSYGVAFYTNDLLLENNSINLESYYYNFVSDFGKQLEGQIKDKYIPAYFGETPNAPAIDVNDFRVVQINTQLNSALDTQQITNTQRQIIETKSQMESLKTTISKEKQNLVSSSEKDKGSIRNKISTYTNNLNVLSTEYSSLVKSLSTLAYENGIVESSPKYRIRGFFQIPDSKHPNNDVSLPAQDIVQFEIAYRYLRLDNTGTALNTFKYIDKESGEEISGVYSDWNTLKTKAKEKIFDVNKNEYVWVNENISSGEEININQLDIPIQKGEKVEFKIRSLSEAGWPNNALKSKWSNALILDFPANLSSNSQITHILTQAKEEEIQIELQNTLGSIGLISHLDDTIPNLQNTTNSIYYKHTADNIAYIEKTNDSEKTMSLQAKLDELTNKLNALSAKQ